MLLKRTLLLLLMLYTCSSIQAQLCQGSLGDPIVNITFGSGSNPGARLPGATTNYQYNTADCPTDGFYSVRNSTSACFNNSWHSLTSDHTGGGNGYFMLVNSSFQPSAFYVDTVDLFCSNTTYEFAAWLMNVSRLNGGCNNNPIQPNITFRIEQLDGTILRSYSTGNIPPSSSPDWKQYGFFFSTPSTIRTVIIRLINNAPGGCGNDVALDDITFKPCGPLINVTVNGSSIVQKLCEGQAALYTFNADVSRFTSPFVQWQESSNNGVTWADIPAANSATYIKNFPSTASAGIYQFRATVAEVGNMAIPQCRVSSSSSTVRVNANPATTTINNGPVCEGAPIIMSAAGGSNYRWTGPSNFMATGSTVTIPNSTIAQAGKYFVEVTNGALCTSFDSSNVVVRLAPTAVVADNAIYICRGAAAQLTATGGSTFQWSPSIGLSSANISNPVATPAISTNYVVRVTNESGCSDTAQVQVDVISLPVVDAGEDKVIAEGSAVQLKGFVSGSVLYTWYPTYNINNIVSLQPTVNPLVDTTYVLTVVSPQGCGTVSDSVKVRVFKKIVIPNAFSPNGDGINDSWIIPALQAYPIHTLRVFNRYGQVVFQTSSFKQWGGRYDNKPLSAGTYYFVLEVKDQQILSGSVTIFR